MERRAPAAMTAALVAVLVPSAAAIPACAPLAFPSAHAPAVAPAPEPTPADPDGPGVLVLRLTGERSGEFAGYVGADGSASGEPHVFASQAEAMSVEWALPDGDVDLAYEEAPGPGAVAVADASGAAVGYVQPDGTVGPAPHVFPSPADAEAVEWSPPEGREGPFSTSYEPAG